MHLDLMHRWPRPSNGKSEYAQTEMPELKKQIIVVTKEVYVKKNTLSILEQFLPNVSVYRQLNEHNTLQMLGFSMHTT